jgi:hypothetical protein
MNCDELRDNQWERLKDLVPGGRKGKRGRPPKLTDDDIEAAKAMLANPAIGVRQITQRLSREPRSGRRPRLLQQRGDISV